MEKREGQQAKAVWLVNIRARDFINTLEIWTHLNSAGVLMTLSVQSLMRNLCLHKSLLDKLVF